LLADDLGLSKRVLISEEFVPDEKRQSYFEAADFIVSTYSSGFHSQTATLATAANARRHVLASSGNSPMRDLVEHFGLGVFVEPDSSEAVADGMATLLNTELAEANWEGFEAHATWETNVTRFLQAAADIVAGNPTPERQFEGLEDEAVPLPKIVSARSFLPAKPVKVSKPKNTAPPKPRPAAGKKTVKRAEPAKPEPEIVAPVALQENPAPAVDSSAQPLFPGFDTPPAKVNGMNGHAHSVEKTEPAKAPKARPTRKPRSRLPKIETPIERERAEVAAV
jgi:hypothetical protein